MKALTILAALLGIAAVSWAAVATRAPDRPAGIAAANWYPINERLGLVVPDYQPELDQPEALPPRALPPARVRTLPPPPAQEPQQGSSPTGPPPVKWLRGYLMVKEGTQWERLAVAGSPSLLNQAAYRP